jgi:acyl-CoA synthetase (AMP-forming)/AMP-acid ligase II
MVLPSRLPDIFAAGRWWSAGWVQSIARHWMAIVDERVGESQACAAALPATPAGVALFAALSARRPPVVLLPPEPQLWPDNAKMFRGLPLVLMDDAAQGWREAERRGFAPIVLDALGEGVAGGVTVGGVSVQSGGAPLVPLRCEGFVVQSSGSTGSPKAAYRPTSHLVAGAMARANRLGLQSGEGLVGGIPLYSGQGAVQMATAMVLGGALGLLDAADHRQTLAAIAKPEFECWRATPHFADVLGRCRIRGTPVAPRICLISSAVSESVHREFRRRFGVPLRGAYSSTETGAIAVEASAPDDVGWDTVGHPLPGVDLRIEHDITDGPPLGVAESVGAGGPGRSQANAGLGRVWVRSPWLFAGYGRPPDLERADLRDDGGWPPRDLARLDDTGRLTLCGRIDDCIRTRDARLVDLAAIRRRLGEFDTVRHVVVLPVHAAAGASIGVVVQCARPTDEAQLRAHMAATLPAWTQPRVLAVVEELPRLANGKPDRMACLALLSGKAEPA